MDFSTIRALTIPEGEVDTISIGGQQVWESGYNDTVQGVPPLSLPNSKGQALKDYKIYGKSVQNGTPTPSNPIEVQSVGERTKNLSSVAGRNDVTWGATIPNFLQILNSLPIGTFTISAQFTLTQRNDTYDASVFGFYLAKSGGAVDSRRTWGNVGVGTTLNSIATITITAQTAGTFTAAYFYGCGINGVGPKGEAAVSKIQIELGSTATSYEPYGYKIPVSASAVKSVSDRRTGESGFVWNQIFKQNVAEPITDNGITYSFVNGRVVLNGTATNNSQVAFDGHNIIAGHKYFRRNLKSNGFGIYGFYALDDESIETAVFNNIYLSISVPNGTTVNNYIYTGMCIDLTLMYGAGNEPSTVEQVKADCRAIGHDLDTYQAYDAGQYFYSIPTITNIYLDEPLRGIGQAWDYIDFARGKRVNAIGKVDLGTLNLSSNSGTYPTNIFYSSVMISDGKPNTTNILTSVALGSPKVLYLNQNSKLIIKLQEQYNSASEIRQAMNGIPLFYELANSTEQSITLPSVLTQKGTNILGILTTVNPNNMNVDYRRTV